MPVSNDPLALLVVAQPVLGHRSGGYSHDSSIGTSNPDWMAKLPATQDYILTATAGGNSTEYTLHVRIPRPFDLGKGPLSGVDRKVIDFPPEPIKRDEVHEYVGDATKGQTMTAEVISPSGDVYLAVFGLGDGIPPAKGTAGVKSWSGLLPATQTYVIQLYSSGGDTEYTLHVEVE